jgi:hypothetical protein
MTPLGAVAILHRLSEGVGRFDGLVADCPLRHTTPNAPRKGDYSERRCCRCFPAIDVTLIIAALRCDGVLPELLDMSKIVSEDAVRRGAQSDR